MLAPYKFPDLTPLAEVKPRFDEVGQCLMDAAQVIRERGWCQNLLRGPEGQVCAIGALKTAANCGDWEFTPLVVSAAKLLEAHLGLTDRGDELGIPEWNDTAISTAEEVISALECAALTRALAIRGEAG